jgi:hypothetical protein
MSFVPNYLSIVEFRVSIPRLPTVQFFTQTTSIPSLSASPVLQPTRFNPVYQTADRLTYSNLDLTFIIDENMQNYLEIYNWLVATTFPERHKQFDTIKTSDEGLYSDIMVTILNSKKNSNLQVTYRSCMPISLSEVALNTTDADVTYPQATATFQYDYFEIGKINA